MSCDVNAITSTDFFLLARVCASVCASREHTHTHTHLLLPRAMLDVYVFPRTRSRSVEEVYLAVRRDHASDERKTKAHGRLTTRREGTTCFANSLLFAPFHRQMPHRATPSHTEPHRATSRHFQPHFTTSRALSTFLTLPPVNSIIFRTPRTNLADNCFINEWRS